MFQRILNHSIINHAYQVGNMERKEIAKFQIQKLVDRYQQVQSDWTSADFCFAMAQAGRVDPTVQALIQNSTFVYK